MTLEYRPLTEEEKVLITSLREDIDKQLVRIFELAHAGNFTQMGEALADLSKFFFVLGKDLG